MKRKQMVALVESKDLVSSGQQVWDSMNGATTVFTIDNSKAPLASSYVIISKHLSLKGLFGAPSERLGDRVRTPSLKISVPSLWTQAQ